MIGTGRHKRFVCSFVDDVCPADQEDPVTLDQDEMSADSALYRSPLVLST